MNAENQQNEYFKKTLDKIKNNISTASLEEVDIVLNYYNKGVISIDGVNYHYQINPIDAACINARYKELTGKDHPVFIMEQNRVLDKFIKQESRLSIDGKPTIYQRLKNNLTGKGIGISILQNKKNSFIDKFDQIQYDISQANLEDVKDILDYYDQDSVLIDGIEYHFRPNALQGASLNARYKELTGEDHPTFLKVQKQVLEEEMKKNPAISVNGGPSIYKELKNNSIEIGNSNHIIRRTDEILRNLQEVNLEEITSLLNHYNGKPVLIDGITHHPFNDPTVAEKLNARYKELTGEDHPVYLEQTPKVINGLLKDKNMLVQSGAYNISYFDKLEEIQNRIQHSNESKSDEVKRIFAEEKNKQRQLDASIRNEQLDAMNKMNQQLQESQQMISESVQTDSIGGIHR